MEKIGIIIGAGANKEIHKDIDLGIELIKNISDRVTDRTSRDSPGLSNISRHFPELTEQVRSNFLIHLDHYMSSVESPSIDAFLDEINTYPEFEKDRPNFLTLGRLLIISHVLGWEGDSVQQILKAEVTLKKTWLSVLADWMEDNGVLKNKKAPLQIATFNYDRILEYFLIERFGHEAIPFINQNIYHVYGRVGRFEQLEPSFPGEMVVAMGHPNDDFATTKDLIKNIRLVNQRSNQANPVYNSFQIYDKIKLITFGYGLDPINNRRLDFARFKSYHENFIFNIYGGTFPNYDFDYRRKTAEKVRAIKMDADIQYLGCTDFLKYAFKKKQ